MSSDMLELYSTFFLCFLFSYSSKFVCGHEVENTKFTKTPIKVQNNAYLHILSTRSQFGNCLAYAFKNIKLPAVDNPNMKHSFQQISEIFVIHYSKSLQRYEFMKSVLQTYNLTARFVTEFDREKIPDLLSCAEKTSGKLTKAEIAVKTAHIAVYYLMTKYKIYNALILEDDAFVVPNEKANLVKSMINMLDQIFLNYDAFFPGGCCNLECKSEEKPVCRSPGSRCTHAYVVTNKGAKKILFNMKDELDHMPIDHMINYQNLVTYWSNPVLFEQYNNIEHVKN